ncbi:OsmC-like protein [Thalassovita gelatinovora]|uniref:OsmC-like protein n=1 Tax=Thalassovita gelatinovora TaxID=53501 RepID=A0A0P1FHR1_THAGE|nr:OsmC family protein [Thalassovita gelatinovora]QIZ81831.1 OsmC family peroxiredoxin [Thalassovita gelatinovora]CUH67126.1 OsmC-like protein [Thalassovita gelatinovora]SEP80101.1 Uncharacterized OsmC-related protein [Thalassovita gelatinovora]
MLEYSIKAKRLDDTGSEAAADGACIILDTGMAGRPDAFNPAELLLASLAACMIKGAERVTPMIKFDLRGLEVSLQGKRQDSPPKMLAIDYELVVDTSETDERIELLHKNIRKYGTISNTLDAALTLSGTIKRKS